MALTPHVLGPALVPVIVAFAMRRWVVAAVAVLVAAVLAVSVLPRAFGAAERTGGPVLRVASANLRVGGGDPSAVVALVRTRSVDLLALQEFTPHAERALRQAGIGSLLPFDAAYPVDGVGGAALFSRYPLTAIGYRPLPPFFGQAYATVHRPGAEPVLVESVHPCAPSDPSRTGDWRRD